MCESYGAECGDYLIILKKSETIFVHVNILPVIKQCVIQVK